MSESVTYIEVNGHTIPMVEVIKPDNWDFQQVFKHKKDNEAVFLAMDQDQTVYLYTTLPSPNHNTHEWVLPETETHLDDFTYIGDSNPRMSLGYHPDMWLQTIHPMTLAEAKEIINDFPD